MLRNTPNGEPAINATTSIKQMSKARVALVLALLFFLIATHAICLVLKTEYWPFSDYPMYSRVHKDQWSDMFLIGMLIDDPEQEIPISYFVYDRPISVKASLDHLARAMEADPDKADDLREALLGLGQIYQSKLGWHRPDDYHEINKLRLIRITWQKVDGPDHALADEILRELIMEVQLSDIETASIVEGV